jgi:hypothetical protein
VREILIVGGGYAGSYTACGLEKEVGRGEARHATVSLRRHLHRTRLIAGTVTEIRNTEHTVTVGGGDRPGAWVVRALEKCGAQVRLNTQLSVSARTTNRWRACGQPATTRPYPAPRYIGPEHTRFRTPSTRCGRASGRRKSIVATLRGRTVEDCVHRRLGVVATPVLGRGIFQYRRMVIKGFPAWLMLLAFWATAALYGRDLVSLASVQQPA